VPLGLMVLAGEVMRVRQGEEVDELLVGCDGRVGFTGLKRSAGFTGLKRSAGFTGLNAVKRSTCIASPLGRSSTYALGLSSGDSSP
jgi:hypothetical protein